MKHTKNEIVEYIESRYVLEDSLLLGSTREDIEYVFEKCKYKEMDDRFSELERLDSFSDQEAIDYAEEKVNSIFSDFYLNPKRESELYCRVNDFYVISVEQFRNDVSDSPFFEFVTIDGAVLVQSLVESYPEDS